MWPWAHAAAGYLLYSLYLRYRDALPPLGPAAVALAVGTQLPDLVDKTAAWYLAVLPTGRSLTHSLLVVVPVAVTVAWYARRRGYGTEGTAFAVGLLSHPLADGVNSFVSAEWQFLAYLAWPLMPTPAYDGPESIVARFLMLEPTPFFLFELLMTAVALALWRRHDYPGLGTLRSWTRSAVRAATS